MSDLFFIAFFTVGFNIPFIYSKAQTFAPLFGWSL